MGKYYNVTVDVEIPTKAIGQHSVFADGNMLFDWNAFDVPKGAGRLLNVSALVTARGNAGATVNEHPFDLVFATTNDVSMGTLNGAANTAPNPDIIGYAKVGESGSYAGNLDGRSFTSTSMTPSDNDTTYPSVVLTGLPTTGTNVGYDKLYVGGIAKGALDFRSDCTINAGDLTGPVLTIADVDPRLFLAVGDKINVCTTADTAVSKEIGVIKSMADANTITLESAFTTAVVDDDFIYHRHPIRLILSFEK